MRSENILLLGLQPELHIRIAKRLKELGHNPMFTIFSKRHSLFYKNTEQKTFFYQQENREVYKEYLKKDISLIDREIKILENKYNIPYHFIINSDRYIKVLNSKKKKIHAILMTKHALNIISENSISIVYGELACMVDLIYYFVAKSQGVKYATFAHGRYTNKLTIDDVYGQRQGLKKVYQEYKKGSRTITDYDNRLLESLLENKTPDYEAVNRKAEKFSEVITKELRIKIVRLWPNLLAYFHDRKMPVAIDYRIGAKILGVLNNMVFPLKKILFKYNFSKTDPNDDYFLLPLHFQPEASTLVFAQNYVDQLDHIKNCARNIPLGTYLYVKEHPSMYRTRRLSELRKLKRIENVKLISPYENTFNLIKKAKGIITLTNTTGIEGIVSKKPVYVFGNVFYDIYDFADKISNYGELYDKIKKNESIAINDLNLKWFLLSSYHSLHEGNYNNFKKDPSVLGMENINKCVQIILNN
ncbi:hypothetical protein [Maribacter polysaccharolyticus]|uniref:capsular polysaccharide export protein, LipB/KpsS family n=1 Tax=Maribacter polysaccharolyticus TaxID=3020831 RepID=UPI00237F0AD5|nr:hypothetical protein [Maribacter polysaccharolyticus]MDE3742222.1 hypothetical protein [Maribacter polysaccharolyticus]